MGDGASECALLLHRVTITQDFELGRSEVTNAEFLAMLRWAYAQGYVSASSTAVRDRLDGSDKKILDIGSQFSEIRYDGDGRFSLRPSPSRFAHSAYPDGYDPSRHPVREVTWYGAAAYCDWLSLRAGLPRAYDHRSWACNAGVPYGAAGYRLPTEAEWEYTARSSGGSTYPWGDAEPSPDRANAAFAGATLGWSKPVGSYPAAPAALGLMDMAGNVWEWCNDWYRCEEDTASCFNPAGPSEAETRVQRGGSWRHPEECLRAAYRRKGHPFSSYSYVGFRIARSASGP